MTDPGLDLTLVIDIGKSNAKLLLIDDTGAVVERHSRSNASVTSPLGYPALDVHGLQRWMQSSLRASVNARRCGHVIASTHGAALVALGEDTLAWEPLDYEFEAVALEGAAHTAFRAASGPFAETLSPELPAGLNAARQLHWLQNTHQEAWRGTRTLLPYAQYWARLLCGVASSEVSSLGCHTHLWNPLLGTYSNLAVTRGWADLFAPLRSAWEVLGTVGTRGTPWGLPADCQVHVGVHDSNACLARYIDQRGDAQVVEPLTLVSSGTWTVLMAPGAPAAALQPAHDMLGNVDVTGRMTPTARFMGGREFAALLDGADPSAATPASVQTLLDTQTLAIPAFSPQGGPFAAYAGVVQRGGKVLAGALAQHLSEAERAALAALYCAQVTAWLVTTLWQGKAPDSPVAPGIALEMHAPLQGRVLVEGPLASNPVYLQMLQALLPDCHCWASSDAVEGTARGAWMLAHWCDAAGTNPAQPTGMYLQQAQALPGVALYQQRWLSLVSGLAQEL
jgi:sugar (pentulose or hexulose) kinase